MTWSATYGVRGLSNPNQYGRLYGNIEEEQRADVGVCGIEGKQDFVEPKVNACTAQCRGLGPDASPQQSQKQEVARSRGGHVQVNLAHIRQRSTTGTPIDFAVFDRRSNSGSQTDNSRLLEELTMKARAAGLKIDQAALAFMESGRITFFGSKHLVEHLSRRGLPGCTHKIDV
jgi:hypothetical protein